MPALAYVDTDRKCLVKHVSTQFLGKEVCSGVVIQITGESARRHPVACKMIPQSASCSHGQACAVVGSPSTEG